MSMDGQRDEDTTPHFSEVEAMALVLEGRHGRYAADVAEFFSTMHGQNGHTSRAWAWAGVADMVRKREKARLAAVR